MGGNLILSGLGGLESYLSLWLRTADVVSIDY
jgi:hypothetical protein